MGSIKRFEDLDVWQRARVLCLEIHQTITVEPFAKDFGLRDQINRSSGSIMDNIAEGFEREGRLEFINSFPMQNLQPLNCDPNCVGRETVAILAMSVLKFCTN